METNTTPQWPLDDPQKLSRFLPTVIREIQYAKGWNDTELAHELVVPRSTLAGWRNGEVNVERIDAEVLARLRTLRNVVQPLFSMKGISPADLVCLCDLADVYETNYQARAEARACAILAQPPSPHCNPAGIYVVFTIRSAFLPHHLPQVVFCDGLVNPHLFVILTNYHLPRATQAALTWRTVDTVKRTLDRSFNPGVYFPRLISTSPPRSGLSLRTTAKHHTTPAPPNGLAADLINTPAPAPSPEQVSEILNDICDGIGYPATIIASHLGVHPSTITRWRNGAVRPEDQVALGKLMVLATVARPILRTKFINPYNLGLLVDTTAQLTGQAVTAAFETLRTTIEQDNITDPVRRHPLDIHIRGANLPASVTAHCLANRMTPPDLFVILVNSVRHNVLEQFNAAFVEIEAHVRPQFSLT